MVSPEMKSGTSATSATPVGASTEGSEISISADESSSVVSSSENYDRTQHSRTPSESSTIRIKPKDFALDHASPPDTTDETVDAVGAGGDLPTEANHEPKLVVPKLDSKGDLNKAEPKDSTADAKNDAKTDPRVDSKTEAKTDQKGELKGDPKTDSKSAKPDPKSTVTEPKKPAPGLMTVETETVSAVPTVPMATAAAPANTGSHLNAGDSQVSLKIKKSVETVPQRPPTSATRKKKSSRLGPGPTSSSSKAEIFAAKIASAVDEAAQSSDSDETFVYESNPNDYAPGPAAPASGTASIGGSRPRFQHRNLSSSSIQRYNLMPELRKAAAGEPANAALSDSRRQSSTQLARVPTQAAPGPAATAGGSIGALGNSTSTLTGSIVSSDTGGAPFSTSSASVSPAVVASSGVPPSATLPGAPLPPSRPQSPQRRSLSAIHGPYHSTSPFLRASTSRHFETGPGGKYSSHGRFRTAYDSDEDDEDLEEAAEADVEDYQGNRRRQDYTEVTPLRGSLSAPGYKSIRRSRKNGGVGAYSPHNYQRKAPSARYRCIRLALWVTFAAICILLAGFIIGFLLASSKPLYDVRVDKIFDIVLSEEELAFDMVIEAINPGLLTIEISEVDLDVFAKSPYAKDEISMGEDEGNPTMLLGNIKQLNAPATFSGSFLKRVKQKAIADVKLMYPGKNSTDSSAEPETEPQIQDGPETELTTLSGKKHKGDDKDSKDDEGDSDLDRGQRKWVKVSSHPFELIVRGVFKYDLILGRSTRTVSLAKTVHVDPDVDVIGEYDLR